MIQIEFKLPKPWESNNQIKRLHWAQEHRLLLWYIREIKLRTESFNIESPLVDVTIEACRYSTGELDPDNLSGGFKILLDAIKLPKGNQKHGLGIIKDDTKEILINLDLNQQKIKRKPGKNAWSEILIHGRYESEN